MGQRRNNYTGKRNMQKWKALLYLSISGLILVLWMNKIFLDKLYPQFKNSSTEIWDNKYLTMRCLNNTVSQNTTNNTTTTNYSVIVNENGTKWMSTSGQSNKNTTQSDGSTLHSITLNNNVTNQKNLIDFSQDISSKHFFEEVEKPTLVPNVVHYIWLGTKNLTFLNALSVYSAYIFIKPSEIIFHGDKEPSGKWWKFVLKNTKNVRFVQARKPLRVYGKTLAYIEHSADILRLRILQEHGGIYLDTDVLVLKSFDPLRKYDVTMGQETKDTLANGIILAKKGAPFLRLILEAYHTYTKNEWGKHSVQIPNQLAKIYPHLVHVEKRSLVKPNFLHAELLFRGHYNWTENYAIHVWWRDPSSEGEYLPTSPMEIAHLDTTLGEVMRKIIFGKPDLIEHKKQRPSG